MPNYKPFLCKCLLSFLVLLSLGMVPAAYPRDIEASDLLPNVLPEMEDPHFWIKKSSNPEAPLLSSYEINKLNEGNLKRPDLFLCIPKDLKREWTREEILAFLKEDWKEFGKTERTQYGKNGVPLGTPFWEKLKEKMNEDSLRDKNQLLFALTLKRSDIRVFPTEEVSLENPSHLGFDRFQHSSVAPGSLVGILHLSRDHLWAYAQTSFIRGWILMRDLVVSDNRREALEYEAGEKPLVVTGSFVKIYGDPLYQSTFFSAQMGTSLPILNLPERTGVNRSGYYVVKVPFKREDGHLTFQKGYIPASDDVHPGFLPYTQKNLAQQAFKMLHQPYGWGEVSGGRDCSRFIMDLFNAFGILMPRNSVAQARMGIPLGPLREKSLEEKKRTLDRAIPLATLVRIPGHIMLYLGKNGRRHYVIHSIWGVQERRSSGPVTRRIGKVVVSDLSLGQTGPNGSLLQRITEIQIIGPETEIKKVKER